MAVSPQGPSHKPKVSELVRRLDEAVGTVEDDARGRNVKKVLEDIIRRGDDLVDPHFLEPVPGHYARRLIHRDPQDRYTVLAMVWGVGQGTPLHDHAGTWCVECVYKGRIKVHSYAVRGGDPETAVVQFSKETEIVAGVGEAGALIPPFEYHIIENPFEVAAVTIHVYGGEMTHCHIFEPVDGGYQRKFRALSYTD